jgi:ATP-dependent helicase/nuclease subunit B
MFEVSSKPRVFALPCGVDVANSLMEGIKQRLANAPPEAVARVEVIVNSDRMAHRLRAAFDAGPAGFLPRIRTVDSCADPRDLAYLAPRMPGLRRRLELMQLVAGLLDAEPTLAPRVALFDLADSLARLQEEMVDEAVPFERLECLDPSDQSGHWTRTLQFLRILRPFLMPDQRAPDPATHRRCAIEARISRWHSAPPAHPVLVAGSTGSRGTTRLLMQAVARLPQGAVVLPGVDRHMPDNVWQTLHDPLTGEDHPQYRFARLCSDLGLSPRELPPWASIKPRSPGRNAVVSLALRPAPVTDQWMRDGPDLPDLRDALSDITLIEAPTPRDEALAIALRLREAAVAGETAALVTPDRALARRVTAALDRWRIKPDDSAGLRLHLTAPGRLMRQVVALLYMPITAEALIALLKHPLTHSGADRGPHLLRTRELELHIRQEGMPFPTPERLEKWARGRKDTVELTSWVDWVCELIQPAEDVPHRALSEWVDIHHTRLDMVASGASLGAEADKVWDGDAGRALRVMLDALQTQAAHGGMLSATDYNALFTTLMRGEEMRQDVEPHPRIFIWGTIEVRAMGLDLMILGGLNEGTWPAPSSPDPWLNRRMRADVGLLLPERQIGLSAHDFQQAAAAPTVWFTRAHRNDEVETVPARWLNRLTNLAAGLPGRNGPEALCEMRDRGAYWLAMARALDQPIAAPSAPRPAPAPPLKSRPRKMSVTEIRRLIRDPYSIYARHVLRLRPLNPLQHVPDALLRGIVLHEIMEHFIKSGQTAPHMLTHQALVDLTAEVVTRMVDWPAVRPLWQARIFQIADGFVRDEAARQAIAQPVVFEGLGKLVLPDLGFTLTGKADRIDLDQTGRAVLYDYKTSKPPSQDQQKTFEKQLLLEAVMVEEGGFADIGPVSVAAAWFLGLDRDLNKVDAPLDTQPVAEVHAGLSMLIAAYQDPERGYPARNAVFKDSEAGDYDHLSRFGEWDQSASPIKQVLK